MSPRQPVVSGERLIKALRKEGWEVVRQRGSHVRLIGSSVAALSQASCATPTSARTTCGTCVELPSLAEDELWAGSEPIMLQIVTKMYFREHIPLYSTVHRAVLYTNRHFLREAWLTSRSAS